MRHALLLSALLAASTLPAAAQEAPYSAPPVPPSMMEDLKRAEEAMRRGVEQMMESVDILLRAVPQYEMPTFNDNGDIIIRRRPPAADRPLAPRRSSDII
jgi:hypothetical protein